MCALCSILLSLVLMQAEAGEVKWRYETNERVGPPAIGSDYSIYFSTNRCNLGPIGFQSSLYALNPDGTLKWHKDMNDDMSLVPACSQESFPIKGVELTTPLIGEDGTLYLCVMSRNIGDSYGFAYAINPATGQCKWFKELASRSSTFAWDRDSRPPAIGPDAAMYFFTSVGLTKEWNHFHSLNSDSTLNWSVNTSLTTAPVIGADGTVYYGSGSGLYALNPNGTEKWGAFPGSTISGLAIGSDAAIYLGSADSCLYAVNPGDGSTKWSFQTSEASVGSPIVGLNNIIYVAARRDSNFSCLYAVNPDGDEKWRYETDRYMTDPTIAADGVIYVGLCDTLSVPALCAIDSAGNLDWSCIVADDSSYISTPVIGPNGTVYVGTDNYLYAVQGSAPLANSVWPMDRHDLSRTGWIDGSGVGGVAENPDFETSIVADLRLETTIISGQFKLNYSMPEGQSGTISAYNTLGQRLFQTPVVSSGKKEFNQRLPNGVYFILLNSNGNTLFSKAVVVR